jgi:hypothetical protein
MGILFERLPNAVIQSLIWCPSQWWNVRKILSLRFHLLDTIIHLLSLKDIPTIMLIQHVNDFHSFHVFVHEELDNVPLLHFRHK